MEVPVEPGVRLMLAGANVKVMPVAAGATVAESATLPVKPRLLAVMVEVCDPPAVNGGRPAGFAARLKSAVTLTVTVDV